MTTPQLPFGTRLIGQTEKTLNAILKHLLASRGMSEHQWIALTISVTGADATRAEGVERLAAALKVSEPEGSDVLDALAARGLIAMAGRDDPMVPTAAGRGLHAAVQARITDITERLWADISPVDQESAAAVLNTTLRRAGVELAALTP